MTTKVWRIRKVTQKDNHTFSIEWNDGITSHYRLSDLQRLCPCARCTDEFSGKRLVNEDSLKGDVKAVKITSVGRYALKIAFTSGCSLGIYDFDLLRHLAEAPLKGTR